MLRYVLFPNTAVLLFLLFSGSLFSKIIDQISVTLQIRYGVREYACSAVDMIARRLRLAFLNNQAAQEALPVVIDIMAEELGWNEKEKKVCVKNLES